MLEKLALLLAIAGGINWGLVGIFQLDPGHQLAQGFRYGNHRRPRRLHPGGHGGDWLPAAAVSEEVKPMGRCFDFPAVSLHLIDKSEKNAYNIIAGKIALYTRVTELTFKCHVLAPATGKPPKGGFFLRRSKWIYLYILMSPEFLTRFTMIFLCMVG